MEISSDHKFDIVFIDCSQAKFTMFFCYSNVQNAAVHPVFYKQLGMFKFAEVKHENCFPMTNSLHYMPIYSLLNDQYLHILNNFVVLVQIHDPS